MPRHAKAARLHAHGERLLVDEIDLPSPADGEVVVEMAFGGVNPVDRYNALGRVGADLPLPRTLGSEGSGTQSGRPVIVRGPGVFSSAVVAEEKSLIEVPDGVDLAAAAALGVAGVTAWRCVTEVAAVEAGDRVLVLGASGGVGTMIVSMAHRLGASVCAQTGSAAKVDLVRRLGADRVVIGDSDSIADEIGDFRPTAVFDPLGDGYTGAALEALAPKGRLVIFGTSAEATGTMPLQPFYRKSLRMLGYGGLMETEEAIAAGIRAALAALAAGRFEVVIDSVVPLEEVNHAFERLVDRSVAGKLLLDLAS
ncbi:MAG TPA: zinc-binding alcohol dehydrogenase family protein [Acidimicrobiales bacterium]|jgi:NADPH2:quinone reductase|nr:zinc-binding alcohol dehydrogenase family protein [Acidimicrobiales bacterium]